MAVSDKTVKEYWDSRAELGDKAGTQDLIAKQLEIRAIEEYVKDGMTILDAGCGNGTTAVELARRHKVHILGVDFSPKMIEAAIGLKVEGSELDRKGLVFFHQADITRKNKFPWAFEDFDLIYTQRAIVNLPDWETQKRTIELLGSYLKPGGIYLMCECSQDGLDAINQLREQVNLAPIVPPWHNRYLKNEEVTAFYYEQWEKGMPKLHSIDFSSTYYFLSRLVNAWLARREGKEPSYDSPVHQLALHLPPIEGLSGQTKLWVWQKA